MLASLFHLARPLIHRMDAETAHRLTIAALSAAPALKPAADDPVLANVPSVAAGQVYGLGVNSFRMDLYSSTEIVEHVRDLFS